MALSQIELRSMALDDEGPYGVFARYLLRQVPDATAASVHLDNQRVAGVWGPPFGQPVVSFAWLFGPPGAAAQALMSGLVEEMKRPMLAFREALLDDAQTLGLPIGRDLLLIHDGPLPGAGGSVRPIDLAVDRPRVTRAIRDRLPPPHLLEHIPFRFWGLERDLAIPAMLDTTVDDGQYSVIQQVFTDAAHRRTGLGRALLEGVVRRLRQDGRIPLYVVSSRNHASIGLARSVGFRVEQEVCVVELE